MYMYVVGLFLKVNNQNDIVTFNCSEDMSETECQLLNSAKISGVITILLAGATNIGLMYKIYHMYYSENSSQAPRLRKYLERELYPVDCIVTSVLVVQEIFAVLCIVLYGVFATSYFLAPNDDVNIEGDDKVSKDGFYSYALYLWITAVIFTAVLALTAGGKGVNNCLLCKSSSQYDLA